MNRLNTLTSKLKSFLTEKGNIQEISQRGSKDST